MPRSRDDFDILREEERGYSRHSRGWSPREYECADSFSDPIEEESIQDSGDWASALTEAVEKLSAALEERRRELHRLDRMSTRLEMIESRLGSLEKASAIVVPITSFDPEPFDLLREIKVVVERVEEDEYLATFFDAGISASGCNPQESVDGLKELLVSRFDYLSSLPPERIGPIPAKQIAVLRVFIRKRG